MRIYIAAPLARFQTAQWWAQNRLGDHEVTSRWHEMVSERSRDPEVDATRAAVLMANLRELDRADAVLALCAQGEPRATLCEIGYAIGRGKPIVWSHGINGSGRNLFDAHQLVRRVSGDGDIAAALATLSTGGLL